MYFSIREFPLRKKGNLLESLRKQTHKQMSHTNIFCMLRTSQLLHRMKYSLQYYQPFFSPGKIYLTDCLRRVLHTKYVIKKGYLVSCPQHLGTVIKMD